MSLTAIATNQETNPPAHSQGDQQPIIQIGWLESLVGIIVFLVAIGIAWGTLKTIVESIKRTLEDKIEPDLKNVRERFGIVENRVETLWKDKFAPANSPRQLNPRGESILGGSGIKKIIDEKKDFLLPLIKGRNVANQYDAEKTILQIVTELPVLYPDVIEELKNGAFKAGANLDDVFLVGGIYLRNQIFKDLGFTLEDLDKPNK